MVSKYSRHRVRTLILTGVIAIDALVCFVGISAGYGIRFMTPLQHYGVVYTESVYMTYLPLLLWGVICLLGSFVYLGLYNPRLLLLPKRVFLIMLRAIIFWVVIFLSSSLILKFHPPISRLFVLTSCFSILALMLLWRSLLLGLLIRAHIRTYFVQRVALVGVSEDSIKLIEAIRNDVNHPYMVCGVVTVPAEGQMSVPSEITELGSLAQMEDIVRQNNIEVVIVANVGISKEDLLKIAGVCEKNYVSYKVIPTFFQIFNSNLRMQTVSGVPILGVGELGIHGVPAQLAKRLMDIVGATIGLLLSAPVIAVLAVLIRRESSGSVIYKQVRTGIHGKPFTIFKLRSMHLDAEDKSGPCWAKADDPRRLKIGVFMREWNLDELPQFWNVLVGDMSLVGPRPERPELISRFENEIPHYNPRHEVRPGITGWAQVHGLRGNTSLTDRVRYDIYYIDNWSFWLDLQILAYTFVARKNAY